MDGKQAAEGVALLTSLVALATAIWKATHHKPSQQARDMQSVKVSGDGNVSSTIQLEETNSGTINNYHAPVTHITNTLMETQKYVHQRTEFGPNPKEIWSHFGSARPYDKKLVSESYAGVSVRWHLFFNHIAVANDGKALVLLKSSTEVLGPDVAFALSIVPEGSLLKVATVGQLCRVEGRVREISTLTIWLRDDPTIYFD